MRGWIVLAAVLLLLFLLGQLRLGAVGEYGPGGAGAWFRAGPVRIRLYPRRRSGPSKKEKAPKPGKEHPAGEACGGGLLELMKELLPLALEAAGCFRRRLRAGAEAHHRRGGPRRRSYPIWTGQRPAGKHLAAPDRGVPCGGGPGSGGGGLHRGGPGADGAGVPVPEAVSAPVAGAALRPAGPEYLCEPSKSA